MDFLPQSSDDLLERKVAAYKSALPPPDLPWSVDVRLFVKYLHEHLFDEELILMTARHECGITDNNFSSWFAEQVGALPKTYVLHHRLTLAKQLMQSQSFSLTQIAHGVGFDTLGAFSRTFRRHFGYAPSSYKD